MELNLKFYNGKDEYSDGDVEEKIINFIKKYPNNYEKAFKEDSSWPVFYHLSNVRKNIIRWYPFKKNSSILEVGGGMGAITEELCQKCKVVTTIELSKRRATAILERNKNVKNLEIIVGNFKDIVLDKKYDYILLNGVLEYGALYMDSGNPYEDFINRLKQNLNDNGKILIAIENRFGLKYWCGANEDHTNKKFDGILGYPNEKSIKTFSKHELEKLASHCKMHYNMYYVFPDYKFPKIIFNDNSLNKKTYSNYFPYYSTKMNLFLSENLLYKEIYENKVIPFFANSYFLEFSLKETKPQVDFIKFNNEYRKKEYDLITYLSNNRIYKKANTKDAEKKIKEILNIHAIAKKCNLPISEIIKDGKEIYSKFLDGENLLDILFNYFSNNEYDKIIQTYDKLYEIIKKSVEKEVFDSNTIFEKYNFAVPKKNNNFKYYKNGFLDIIPSNIMLTNDKYILIDQEWYEENVPVEYIMFRCIYYFFDHIDTNHSLALKLYKKYNINSKFFLKFEMVYMKNLRNQFISYYSQYCNNINYCDNIDNLIDKEVPRLQMQEENFRQLQKKFAILQEENKNVNLRLDTILNSRGYKLLSKYYRFVERFKKNKK